MYNMDISILGCKVNLQILILIGIIYLVFVAHTVGGCCNMPLIMEGYTGALSNIKEKKEGFTGANTNYGESSQYTLGDYSKVNTSSWGQPTMTVTPGSKYSKGVQDFLNRKPQPVPLPEGEMLMFANTPFKPECCPNTYSNGSGCACMTGEQYNYLVTRSGNNVPYSEY
jgi:hypothetical protein